MFAIVIAGRLVQTEFSRVDATKFLFSVSDLDNVNHIVVFMTGSEPFPEGFGGAVYLQWASSDKWQLVGHITNEKPSAIFKISGLKQKPEGTNAFLNLSGFSSPNMANTNSAQLGISIESVAEISNQVSSLTADPIAQGNSFNEFVEKMLHSFYNYASSFATTAGNIASGSGNFGQPTLPNTEYIPATVLERWFKQFQSKLTRDINFWKK